MLSGIKLLILCIVILFTIACNRHAPALTYGPRVAADTVQLRDTGRVHSYLFGIPADLYNLTSGKIKQNGFLSKILLDHGITMQELDMVLRNSAAVFDVRKIRSGNNYTIFCDKDSSAKARYLVYEHDPSTCYVFSFNDSLNITPFRKEVSKKIKYVSATIETSLWDAMLGGGLPPDLVSGLSEIFAWSVDFFGLQKGDSFKVIYEETSIDGKITGISRICGAEYCGAGSAVYAVPFIQDGRESFFDSKGNSLRKEFLKAPLQFSRVTSHFSASRMHPILRIRRPHYGVDYAAPIGTPVHAIGDGRVVSVSFDGGAGRMVKIVHNSVYATAYLHLSRFGDGIAPGVIVKQGDIIGYVGNSGLATGPHLDFRFYKNGSPVDPLKVEAPPVEPVSQSNIVKFEKSKAVIMDLLETI